MTPQLIIAGVIAAASFCGAWTIQNWRYGAKESDRAKQTYEAVLESQRLAFRAQTQNDARVLAAQSAAAVRTGRLRADADRARTAADSLSVATAEAVSRANLSHAACADTTRTLGELFDASTRKYRALAEEADRIVSDRQMMIDAWPVANSDKLTR